MILVDKNIKSRIEQNELIVEGYNESGLSGVSYDLRIEYIIDDKGSQCDYYDIKPFETVFIRTKEKLKIPHDILGRIAEKNSRMRMGIKVDGPHYQPGHCTYAFLRVQNISKDVITLSAGMTIAQIMFEQLNEEPEVTYDQQEKASFQNEKEYRGLGNYQKELESKIKKQVEYEKERLDDVSKHIYGNILTLMGVFVAIFSLISVNYQAFTQTTVNIPFIVAMNASMGLCITLMMSLVAAITNSKNKKPFIITGLVIAIVMIVAIIVSMVAV